MSLDVATVPKAVCDRWLSCESSNELVQVLDELIRIYSSLDYRNATRLRIDVPKVLRQLHANLTSQNKALVSGDVIIRCFKLIDILFDNVPESFMQEIPSLYPVVLSFVEDNRLGVRKLALHLACNLCTSATISVVQRFILAALEKNAAAIRRQINNANKGNSGSAADASSSSSQPTVATSSATYAGHSAYSSGPYLLKIVSWLLLVIASSAATAPSSDKGGSPAAAGAGSPSAKLQKVDIPIELVILVRRLSMVARDFLVLAEDHANVTTGAVGGVMSPPSVYSDDALLSPAATEPNHMHIGTTTTDLTIDNTTDAAIDVITLSMLLLSNSTLGQSISNGSENDNGKKGANIKGGKADGGKFEATLASSSSTESTPDLMMYEVLPPKLTNTLADSSSHASLFPQPVQAEILYRIQMELFPSLEKDRIISLLLFGKMKGQFEFLFAPYSSLSLPTSYYAAGSLSKSNSEYNIQLPPSKNCSSSSAASSLTEPNCNSSGDGGGGATLSSGKKKTQLSVSTGQDAVGGAGQITPKLSSASPELRGKSAFVMENSNADTDKGDSQQPVQSLVAEKKVILIAESKANPTNAATTAASKQGGSGSSSSDSGGIVSGLSSQPQEVQRIPGAAAATSGNNRNAKAVQGNAAKKVEFDSSITGSSVLITSALPPSDGSAAPGKDAPTKNSKATKRGEVPIASAARNKTSAATGAASKADVSAVSSLLVAGISSEGSGAAEATSGGSGAADRGTGRGKPTGSTQPKSKLATGSVSGAAQVKRNASVSSRNNSNPSSTSNSNANSLANLGVSGVNAAGGSNNAKPQQSSLMKQSTKNTTRRGDGAKSSVVTPQDEDVLAPAAASGDSSGGEGDADSLLGMPTASSEFAVQGRRVGGKGKGKSASGANERYTASGSEDDEVQKSQNNATAFDDEEAKKRKGLSYVPSWAAMDGIAMQQQSVDESGGMQEGANASEDSLLLSQSVDGVVLSNRTKGSDGASVRKSGRRNLAAAEDSNNDTNIAAHRRGESSDNYKPGNDSSLNSYEDDFEGSGLYSVGTGSYSVPNSPTPGLKGSLKLSAQGLDRSKLRSLKSGGAPRRLPRSAGPMSIGTGHGGGGSEFGSPTAAEDETNRDCKTSPQVSELVSKPGNSGGRQMRTGVKQAYESEGSGGDSGADSAQSGNSGFNSGRDGEGGSTYVRGAYDHLDTDNDDEDEEDVRPHDPNRDDFAASSTKVIHHQAKKVHNSIAGQNSTFASPPPDCAPTSELDGDMPSDNSNNIGVKDQRKSPQGFAAAASNPYSHLDDDDDDDDATKPPPPKLNKSMSSNRLRNRGSSYNDADLRTPEKQQPTIGVENSYYSYPTKAMPQQSLETTMSGGKHVGDYREGGPALAGKQRSVSFHNTSQEGSPSRGQVGSSSFMGLQSAEKGQLDSPAKQRQLLIDRRRAGESSDDENNNDYGSRRAKIDSFTARMAHLGIDDADNNGGNNRYRNGTNSATSSPKTTSKRSQQQGTPSRVPSNLGKVQNSPREEIPDIGSTNGGTYNNNRNSELYESSKNKYDEYGQQQQQQQQQPRSNGGSHRNFQLPSNAQATMSPSSSNARAKNMFNKDLPDYNNDQSYGAAGGRTQKGGLGSTGSFGKVQHSPRLSYQEQQEQLQQKQDDYGYSSLPPNTKFGLGKVQHSPRMGMQDSEAGYGSPAPNSYGGNVNLGHRGSRSNLLADGGGGGGGYGGEASAPSDHTPHSPTATRVKTNNGRKKLSLNLNGVRGGGGVESGGDSDAEDPYARKPKNNGAFDQVQPSPPQRAGGGMGRVQHSPRAGGNTRKRGELDPNDGPSPTSAAAAAANAELEYVALEDLQPCAQARKEYSRVLSTIESADWPEIFHVITTIRCLTVHHSEVVTSNNASLRQLIKGLLKQVSNLRSQVSKNALIAIGDLFNGLGRQLDGEAAAICSALAKRVCDSSTFVSESCEAAIMSMVYNSSANRSLGALLANLDNRSPQIRGKMTILLYRLMDAKIDELKQLYQRDNSMRELDSLLNRLPKFIADHTPEARAAGREIIKLLLNNRVLSARDLETYVPADQIDKAMKDNSNIAALKNAGRSLVACASPMRGNIGAGAGTPNARQQVNNRGGPYEGFDGSFSPTPTRNNNDYEGNAPVVKKISGGNHRPTARKLIDSNPELHDLEELFKVISTTKNWNERKEKLSRLTDLIVKYSTVLAELYKFDIAMDHLYMCLQDGSIKVCMFAIGCVEKVFDEVSCLLTGTAIKPFVAAIVNAAASAQGQLSSAASQILSSFSASVSTSVYIQQMLPIALHHVDKDRMRCVALRSIAENTRRIASEQHGALMKQIFPGVSQILCSSQTKAEVRVACGAVLKAIQQQMPQQPLWQLVNDVVQQEELKRVLN